MNFSLGSKLVSFVKSISDNISALKVKTKIALGFLFSWLYL